MENHLLSDAAIFCGTGSSLLVFLDWLLTARQKEVVRDATTRVWYWLSVQTPQSYLRLARTKVAFVVCLVLGLLLFFAQDIAVAFSRGENGVNIIPYEAFFIIVLILLSAPIWYFYGYRVYSWLISGTGPFRIFRDLTGLGVFIAIVFAAPIELARVFLGESTIYAGYVITGLFVWNPLGSLILSPFLILILPTQIVMLIVSAAMLLFVVLRTITVKIAEHDKGPVLAISALLTMIGAIVKTIQ